MAFRMKHWLAMTAFGLALVAVWRLPPESFRAGAGPVKSAEDMRRDALEDEVQLTSDVLRRVLWADSLSALMVGEADDGILVAFPTPDAESDAGALADQRARLLAMAKKEVESLGARAPDMTFGYVVQPTDQSLLPGMPNSNRERVETFVGTRDGTRYCLQVRVAHPMRIRDVVARKLTDSDLSSVSPRSGLLGPCRFYVKYGMPGTGMTRWLEGGGIEFAMESTAPEPTDLLGSRWSRRTFFGLTTSGFFDAPIEFDRCHSGDARACAFLFENPTAANRSLANQIPVVEASPATSIGGGQFFRSIAEDEEYLLADLEAEFGPEAFARFWQADATPVVAFESAFGVSAGDWIVRWIDRTTGVEPPGPGLPRSASSGAMLAVAVLLGIAFLRNREREVT